MHRTPADVIVVQTAGTLPIPVTQQTRSSSDKTSQPGRTCFIESSFCGGQISDYATARRPGMFQGCLSGCVLPPVSVKPTNIITADESCVQFVNKDSARAEQKGCT